MKRYQTLLPICLTFLFLACICISINGQTAYIWTPHNHHLHPQLNVIDLETNTIVDQIFPKQSTGGRFHRFLTFALSPNENLLYVLESGASKGYKNNTLYVYNNNDHSLIKEVKLHNNDTNLKIYPTNDPDIVYIAMDTWLRKFDLNRKSYVKSINIGRGRPANRFAYDLPNERFYELIGNTNNLTVYDFSPSTPTKRWYLFSQGSKTSGTPASTMALFLDASTNKLYIPRVVRGASSNFKLFSIDVSTIPSLGGTFNLVEEASIPITLVETQSNLSPKFSINKDFDEIFIEIMDNNENKVFHVDLTTKTLKGQLTLPFNNELYDPVFHPTMDNLAYVSINNNGDNFPSLIPFDLNTRQAIPEGEISGGLEFIAGYTDFSSQPWRGLTVVTSAAKLPKPQKASYPDIGYILTRPVWHDQLDAPSDRGAFENGKLLVINTKTQEIQQVIPMDRRPENGIFSAQHGNLYIFSSESKTIKVLDAATLVVKKTIQLPTTVNAHKLVGVNQSGNWLYLIQHGIAAAGTIYALSIDPITLELTTGMPANPILHPITQESRTSINPEGTKLCVYDVSDAALTTPTVQVYDISNDSPFSPASPTATPITANYTDISGTEPFVLGNIVDSVIMDYSGSTLYLWDRSGNIAGYSTTTGVKTKGPLGLPYLLPLRHVSLTPNGRQLIAFNKVGAGVIYFINKDLTKKEYCSFQTTWFRHLGTNKKQYISKPYSYGNQLYLQVTNSEYQLYPRVSGRPPRTQISNEPDYMPFAYLDGIQVFSMGPLREFRAKSMEWRNTPGMEFPLDRYYFNVSRTYPGVSSDIYELPYDLPIIYPGGAIRDIIFPVFAPNQVPPVTGRAYIPNTSDNTVSVLNLETDEEELRIALPAAAAPERLATSPDGTRVYITNTGSNQIEILETATNELSSSPIQVTPTNESLLDVVVSPNNEQVFAITEHATNATSGYLRTYNVPAGTESGSAIGLGLRPHAITVTETGTALVSGRTATGGGLVVIPSGTTTAPTPIALTGEAIDIAIAPEQDVAYIGIRSGTSAGAIATLDLTTNTLNPGQIALPGPPAGLALSPDGNTLLAAIPDSDQVSVIDLTQPTPTANNVQFPASSGPDDVTVSSDGEQAYVSLGGTNTVAILDISSTTILPSQIAVGEGPSALENMLASYIPAAIATVDDAEAYVPIVKPSGNKYIAIAEIDDSRVGAQINTSTGPFQILTSPNGEAAYLSDQSGSTIQHINTLTKRSQDFQLGFTPTGMALDKDQETLYVTGSSDNSISLVDAFTGVIFSSINPVEAVQNISISPQNQQIFGKAVAGTGMVITDTKVPNNSVKKYATETVERIVFHPTNDIAFVQVSTGGTTSIKVYDGSTGADAGWGISGNLNNMSWFDLSPDGNTLYYTDATAKKLYKTTLDYATDVDLTTTAPTELYDFGAREPVCFQIDPSGTKMYALTNPRVLIVLDLSATPATATPIDLVGNPIGTGTFMRFP